MKGNLNTERRSYITDTEGICADDLSKKRRAVCYGCACASERGNYQRSDI